MTISEMFKELLANLAIDNTEQISLRYGEITTALNKKFRSSDSKTANTLQVGSYGRKTAIKGISDLDMLYIMPKSEWDTYKDNKQLKLLQDVKAAIDTRYPSTATRVDRQVVVATFTNFEIEVLPVFEQDDGSFKYPDTYDGGSWCITKPRKEIKAISDMDSDKNSNLRRLCKMTRAWKNKHGVAMGGLLIDTLAHNYLKSTDEYNDKSYTYYDWMIRDFFKYLSELPEQAYYLAPGSNQQVKVKKKFQSKAKKAYKLCLKAIEAGEEKSAHNKWKKVFGRPFPAKEEVTTESSASKSEQTWQNTEEFIEDKYPVDIRYALTIDCKVTQDGFREFLLRGWLKNKIPLKANKRLRFSITLNSTPEPFKVKWKVLNRGDVAKKRNCIRGQIFEGAGNQQLRESTDFTGEHIVECYIIKNGVVVAKDRIDVPIQGANL